MIIQQVFKYQLQVISDQRIEMPKDAKVLHVGVQNNVMCLWAMVDGNAPLVKRHIGIYGTGHYIPVDVEPSHFVGTVMAGMFVWHIFDLGEVA